MRLVRPFALLASPYTRAFGRWTIPFLRFAAFLVGDDDDSFLRVCADDVAAALADITSLSKFAEVFRVLEHFTYMKLGPAKCVLVPAEE